MKNVVRSNAVFECGTSHFHIGIVLQNLEVRNIELVRILAMRPSRQLVHSWCKECQDQIDNLRMHLTIRVP